MRLSLTLHDERGALEVTSVECENFVGGCYRLEGALSTALLHYRADCIPASTAGLPREAVDLMHTLAQLGGDYELRPVVSC